MGKHLSDWVCIHKNKVLNIRLITYDLFVTIGLFVQPEVSGCEYVFGPGTSAA